MNLYDQTAYNSSKIITTSYSTSFILGIKTLANPIYAIYGFVRYADEVADAFHDLDKGRMYFPGFDFNDFSLSGKKQIEEDIQKDFEHALTGIKRLPKGAKLGVYLAYIYYLKSSKK